MKPAFGRKAAAATLALLSAAAILDAALRPEPPPPATDDLVIAEVVRPWVPASGVVFLISGADGYGSTDAADARVLRAAGAIVVGIDLKKTFERVSRAPFTDCVYFVSDVEQVSQDLQRAIGGQAYRDPIVIGRGAGATMALALAAQSPDATIGRTVAIDPEKALRLNRELCTGAPHVREPDGADGWTYDLQPGDLPDPIEVHYTPAAPADGRDHVGRLIQQGFAISTATTAEDAERALRIAGTDAVIAGRRGDDRPLADLPLAVLPAKPKFDTMAVVLSGDGGWRDIDMELARVLAQSGVPTVGLDSLRYFWQEKPPKTVAADLGRIVDTYGRLWKTTKVVLVGYSFGADVLPATYLSLAPETAARVRLVSLMALSHSANFEIQVAGWVGMDGDNPDHPTLPDLERFPPGIVQCVYGADDDDTVCPDLPADRGEVIKTEGGHHFDGDYAALAGDVLARLK